MSIITIENDDQKIVSTNYWMSEYSRAGKIYCSINARAFRRQAFREYLQAARPPWKRYEDW